MRSKVCWPPWFKTSSTCQETWATRTSPTIIRRRPRTTSTTSQTITRTRGRTSRIRTTVGQRNRESPNRTSNARPSYTSPPKRDLSLRSKLLCANASSTMRRLLVQHLCSWLSKTITSRLSKSCSWLGWTSQWRRTKRPGCM